MQVLLRCPWASPSLLLYRLLKAGAPLGFLLLFVQETSPAPGAPAGRGSVLVSQGPSSSIVPINSRCLLLATN